MHYTTFTQRITPLSELQNPLGLIEHFAARQYGTNLGLAAGTEQLQSCGACPLVFAYFLCLKSEVLLPCLPALPGLLAEHSAA